MGFIFDFDFRLDPRENWMFNFNHLMIIVFFVLVFSALYFGLHAKSKRGILVTKLTLATVLIIFELGRILYRYLHAQHHGYEPNWWTIWSFEICATMVWVTAGTLIASLFVDTNNRTLVVFKNILFGAGAVGAGLTFVMPTNIRTDLPVFHWVNGQSIITHLLLVFVPFYLIKIGELKIYVKNMWMPALGFFGVLTVAITAAHISGNNFFVVLEDNLFNRIIGGNGFAHPIQIFVIFFVGLLLGTLLYGSAHLIRRNSKIEVDVKVVTAKSNKLDVFTVLPYITGIAMGILVVFLPAIMGADFGNSIPRNRALNSWLAIFVLVPFILQVIFIYWLEEFKKKKKIVN